MATLPSDFRSRRLITFASWYALAGGILKAGTFGLGLWMARTLTVGEYGTWGVALGLQTAIVIFGSVGMTESVVGLLSRHPTPEERTRLYAAANRVFLITLFATTAIASATILAFPDGGVLLPAQTLAVAASGALIAFATFQGQLVRLEGRHVASLGYQVLVPAAALVASAAFVFLRPSAESFFVGSAVGGALALVALHVGRAGVPNRTPDRAGLGEILRRLPPYIAVAFFGWLSGYGITLVVSGLFPLEEIARLTFALNIGAILQLAASSMNQVWGPRFFATTHTEPMEVVERGNRRFFFLQTVLLGLLAVVLLVLLPPALRLAGGNLAAYSAMRWEIFFVVAAYLVLAPWWHAQNYFYAHDRGADLMRVTIVSGLAGLLLWLLCMVAFGAIGIYAGFFAQVLVRSAATAHLAGRIWPLRIGWENIAVGLLLAVVGLSIGQIWPG